jgi:mono/diheme cytochrome c family protein
VDVTRSRGTFTVVALGAVLVVACVAVVVRKGREPERFGVGRPATSAEIAAWNTDVNASGDGLPLGHGSVTEGARLYAVGCARCHGAQGEGGAGSQLIRPSVVVPTPRRNIATHWPFAPPLFDYIRRTMPPEHPRSLSDADVYALVAYLLAENGIVPMDAVVDATSLPRVRMPARDRFVRDDRTGGREVK